MFHQSTVTVHVSRTGNAFCGTRNVVTEYVYVLETVSERNARRCNLLVQRRCHRTRMVTEVALLVCLIDHTPT